MGRDPPKGPTLRGVFFGNGDVQVLGVSCFRMKIMCCTQTAESNFWCCSVGSLEDMKCIRRLGLDRLEARIVSASSASIQKAIGGSDACSNGYSNIARIPVRFSLNLCLQCVPATCQASSCNALKKSAGLDGGPVPASRHCRRRLGFGQGRCRTCLLVRERLPG